MEEGKLFEHLLNGGNWEVEEFRIIVAPYKGFPPNNGMDKSPYGVLLIYVGDFQKIAEWYLYDMEKYETLMGLYDKWKNNKNEVMLERLISIL